MRKFIFLILLMACAAPTLFAQDPPTLRIVTTNPGLPSELFYGNQKVIPVRLRPGTNTPITIDDSDFFLFQHYVDFLSRLPDQGGLDYWTNQIASCNGNAACIESRRVDVSAAYFLSQEFKDTGFYVYDLYKATLGRYPTYAQFAPDREQVVGGGGLDTSKNDFASAWVARPEFQTKYAPSLTPTQFVDALIATTQQSTNISLAGRRNEFINLAGGAGGRAAVVRAVADDASILSAESNRAFVALQYWGYLRRDFDQGGYDYWLNNIPQQGNARGMVCNFVTSAEYQLRFGTSVTRNNQVCANF